MIVEEKWAVPYVELDKDGDSDHNSRLRAVHSEGEGRGDFGVLWWQQAATSEPN